MCCVVRHALLLDVGKFCKAFVDFDTNYLLESHWGQLRNTQAPKAAPEQRRPPHSCWSPESPCSPASRDLEYTTSHSRNTYFRWRYIILFAGSLPLKFLLTWRPNLPRSASIFVSVHMSLVVFVSYTVQCWYFLQGACIQIH